MVVWTGVHVERLRELAARGFMGQDVATRMSAEFGVEFTTNSVFTKANRLGIAIAGRSPRSDARSSLGDPFDPPRWLRRELERIDEEKPPERPYRFFLVGLDDPSPSEELRESAYREMWNEYIDSMVSKALATEDQADAVRNDVARWFRAWAQVFTVRTWRPQRVEQIINKHTDDKGLDWEGLTEDEQDTLIGAARDVVEQRPLEPLEETNDEGR